MKNSIIDLTEKSKNFVETAKNALTPKKHILINFTKFNKNFLYKSLREIFGQKISGRITNFSPDHNKNFIEFLFDEKNENNE